MQLLIEKIPQASFLRNAEIWADGFTFFNPQERRVLSELLALGCMVHVTMPLATDLRSRENLSETGLFHRSWRTIQQLREEAKAQGVDVTVRALQMPNQGGRFKRPALAAIEQGLFHQPLLPAAVDPVGILLVEAANRRIEVEAVAADILRRARKEGYRFHEIGILVRDAGYLPPYSLLPRRQAGIRSSSFGGTRPLGIGDCPHVAIRIHLPLLAHGFFPTHA